MDAPPVQYATTSDGFRIAYGVSGSGTPLLFLPGVFYHVQLAWQYPGLEPWIRGLAERFQLIQLDPRGTGMSSRDVGEGHSRAHYQRDIEAVLQRLEPGPFLLLAASSGVDLAVDYALAHPENVTALLLGTSGTSKVHTPMFEMLPASDFEVFLQSIIPRTRSRDEAGKMVELMKQASDQRNYFLRRRVLYAPGKIEEALARLQTPTLVMHARDYALTPVEEGMKIAQHSGGRLVLIDGADPWGDAAQGIRAIEAFLAKFRAGTQPALSFRMVFHVARSKFSGSWPPARATPRSPRAGDQHPNCGAPHQPHLREAKRPQPCPSNGLRGEPAGPRPLTSFGNTRFPPQRRHFRFDLVAKSPHHRGCLGRGLQLRLLLTDASASLEKEQQDEHDDRKHSGEQRLVVQCRAGCHPRLWPGAGRGARVRYA